MRAQLLRRVKTLLMNRKYPPDKQQSATELVVDTATLFAEDLLAA